MNFEENVEQLEKIVQELEKGDSNYNPNFRLDEKDFRLNVHVRR